MANFRPRIVVGPALRPETTTGLPVFEPDPETSQQSGVAGDNFRREGTGFGNEPDGGGQGLGNVWSGADHETADPTGHDSTGAVMGGVSSVLPTREVSGTPEDAWAELLRGAVARGMREVWNEMGARFDFDRPIIMRDEPSQRATTAIYVVPFTGQGDPVKGLSEDPSRRRALITCETNGIRIGSERHAVANGQGFLVPAGVTIEWRSSAVCWMIGNTTGQLSQFSLLVESGEPIQVPIHGKFREERTVGESRRLLVPRDAPTRRVRRIAG